MNFVHHPTGCAVSGTRPATGRSGSPRRTASRLSRGGEPKTLAQVSGQLFVSTAPPRSAPQECPKPFELYEIVRNVVLLMRPDELERRLQECLDALPPAARSCSHVLMLPGSERAGSRLTPAEGTGRA